MGLEHQFLLSAAELTLCFVPFFPPVIFSGDVDSAVEMLESVFTSSDSTSPSMSFVFRKVLEEDNDKALDKCKTHRHTWCPQKKNDQISLQANSKT